MQLVGRREELGRIAQMADAVRESALVVCGDPGVGKSRLLQAAQAEATIRCVLVHTMPAEASWPLSGFSRVFAFINDISTIEFSGHFAPRSTERSDTFDAARNLLSTLRSLAPEPILVLVDDIDHMDQESQVLLSFIAEGLAGTGIRLVATASHIPLTSPLAGLRRIDLPPLTPSESRELAYIVAGPASDPGSVRIVADDAAGSPLAIVENAQTLTPAQVQGREPIVLPFRPVAIHQDRVVERLAGLGAPETRLLELVSLAPTSHSSALASSDDADEDLLEDLLYSGLLQTHGHYVRLADPRMRSHLYWNLDPRTRREYHREMAEAHRHVDARIADWHSSFVQSGDSLPDTLLTEATHYAEEGDTAAAIEFAERALRIAEAVADHLGRIIELASAFYSQIELDLALRYAVLARHEATSTALSMKLASLLVSIEYAKTHVVPTNDIDAILSIYSATDPEGAVELLSIAAECHAERWEVDEARRYLARARQLAGGVQDAGVLRDIELLVDAIDGVATAPIAEPDVLDTGTLTSLTPRALVVLGKTMTFRENYARARHIFTIVLTQPQVTPPLWMESARYLLAVNEVRSGNFHRARSAVEDWLAFASPGHSGKSSRLALHAWYLNSSGQQAEAKILFDTCMDQTLVERNPAVAAQALALQGGAALAEGDFNEAARVLELADVIGQRFANPALLRHSIDLIESYVATKRTREARSVLEGMERLAPQYPSRWLTLALARGRGLVAPDDECLALFQHAHELFTADDSSYELGRTLTNFASAQARLGLARDSEKSLAEARNAFGNAGAQSWVVRADQYRAQPDTDVLTAIGVLTEEEQLIVEKVREGYRNKEIAAALYISLRTVELRLTHIYRKVGARSRSHLAALLN
jgi:DNA-binding CsgD family transcriptional regulator